MNMGKRLYAVDFKVKVDAEKHEGEQLTFLMGLDFFGLIDIGGIDELNGIVDDTCDGFILQNIDYTPVKMEKGGRVIVRVSGEITNY